MSTPESFDDQLARVQQMAHDANGETYDLGRADREALLAVLRSHTELLDALRAFCGDDESTPPDTRLASLHTAYHHARGAMAHVESSS